MRTHPYYFSNLFQRALQDWPQKIDEAELTFYKTSEGYTVDGLGDIYEEIDSKYILHKEEVIFREINTSIYSNLKEAFYFLKKIDLLDLREKSIKEEFERRLQEAVKHRKECRLEDSDVALIEEYFAANVDYPGKKFWVPPPEYYKDSQDQDGDKPYSLIWPDGKLRK